MDLKIPQFAGIDLTPLAKPLGCIATWQKTMQTLGERLFMGMKSLRYNAVSYFYLAEKFAQGNPRDEKNVLRYDCVVLNL